MFIFNKKLYAKFFLNIKIISKVYIKYNKNIYNELLIKGIMCHFSNLADQFSHDENRQLKNVNFLSDSERQTILHGFNDTAAGIPEEETILDVMRILKEEFNT